MMRLAALFVISLILTSCAKPSGPIDTPDPVALDPRLCVEALPEPSIKGSVVQPVTEEEREATASFLTSVAAHRDWGRRGWELLGVARSACAR
jgi:hypothetical protein